MKNLFFFFVFILGMTTNSFAQSNCIAIGEYNSNPACVFRYQIFDEFNNAPLKNFSVEMRRENYIGAKAVTDDLGVFVMIVYDPTMIRDTWVLKIYDPKFEYTSYEQIIVQSDVYIGRKHNNVLMLYVEDSRPVWWGSTSAPDQQTIAYHVSLGKYKIHKPKQSNVGYSGPEFFEKTIKLRYQRHPKDQQYSPSTYTPRSDYNSSSNMNSNENLKLYSGEELAESEIKYRKQQLQLYNSSTYREAEERRKQSLAEFDAKVRKNQEEESLRRENEELKRRLQEKEKGTSEKALFPGKKSSSNNYSAPINIGAGSVCSDLFNRKILSVSKLSSDISSEGIIVVSIKVDGNGNVVFAKAGEKGSTTMNPELLNFARLNALKLKFDKSDATSQVGTVMYSFEIPKKMIFLVLFLRKDSHEFVKSFQKCGEPVEGLDIKTEIESQIKKGEVKYDGQLQNDIYQIYVGESGKNSVFVLRSKPFPKIYAVGFGTNSGEAYVDAKKDLEIKVLNAHNSANTSFDVILDKEF